MRKYFFGLFVGVFGLVLLTGCGSSDSGNKVTCSTELNENGTKYGTAEIIAKLDGSDKVSSVKVVMNIDDKTMAQQVYAMLTLANSFAEDDSKKINATLDGQTITIENGETYMSQTEEGTNVVGMSKTDFIKNMESTTDEKVVCK